MPPMSLVTPVLASAGLVFLGCAAWDNPTALSDLQADVTFDLDNGSLETFREVEIQIKANADGIPMHIVDARLEIHHEPNGSVRAIPVEHTEDGYHGTIVFQQAGEHLLHLMGKPEGHHLMWEMGEHHIEVTRHHLIIDPYWVEFSASDTPIVEGTTTHVHLFVFDRDPEGQPAEPVSDLAITVEAHAPDGHETIGAAVEDEPGVYELEMTFEDAGMYDVHITLDDGVNIVRGELHVPVLATEPDQQEPGGPGHDHP